MPVTTPDGIYYADTSTTSNDVNVSAAEATSVQAALDSRRIRSYHWADAAERARQLGMSPGDTGYQFDSSSTWTFYPGGWVRDVISTQHGFVEGTGTSVANATEITSLPLAAVPFSTRTLLNVAMIYSIPAGSGTIGVQVQVDNGTVFGHQGESQAVTTAAWWPVAKVFSVTIPANTTATITFRTRTSVAASYRFNAIYSRSQS